MVWLATNFWPEASMYSGLEGSCFMESNTAEMASLRAGFAGLSHVRRYQSRKEWCNKPISAGGCAFVSSDLAVQDMIILPGEEDGE
jgi:hypothetical protein